MLRRLIYTYPSVWVLIPSEELRKTCRSHAAIEDESLHEQSVEAVRQLFLLRREGRLVRLLQILTRTYEEEPGQVEASPCRAVSALSLLVQNILLTQDRV